MSRRMKLVFTISLLLNIVFIGVGAGMLVKMCQDVPIPGDISPESRSFIARTFQKGWEDVKPLIAEVKQKRKNVEAILMAETFEPKAYDKAVDELLATQNKILQHRADTMGKALIDLPVSDRQKFANRILEGLEGARPRHGGRHGKKPGEWKKQGEAREAPKTEKTP